MLLELGGGVRGGDKGLEQMARAGETDRWEISSPPWLFRTPRERGQDVSLFFIAIEELAHSFSSGRPCSGAKG